MPKTVLIVEDNEKNLKLFKVIIESMGHQTLIARDGGEGVRIALGKIPDLILMDIQMPVMDGFAAQKLIRADARTKDIPVIAITSYAMKGDRERLISEGFAHYISKPIEKDAFIRDLQALLDGKR